MASGGSCSSIEADGSEGDTDWSSLVERLAGLNRPAEPAPAEPQDEDEPEALPFGQMAVQAGMTTPQAVERAVAAQRHGDPRHIGEILVEAGELEPGDVVDTLSAQAETPRRRWPTTTSGSTSACSTS